MRIISVIAKGEVITAGSDKLDRIGFPEVVSGKIPISL